MIFYSSLNRYHSIDLFVEHQPGKFVAEGHGAERESLPGLCEEFWIEAQVGTDEKGDRVRPLFP